MILITKKQQLDFLSECHKHIIRIYNTYLTDSEKQDALPDSAYNTPHLMESNEKLSEKLPQSIRFGGWLHNIKMGKLYMLISIYNEASKKITLGEEIDLNIFFPKIKYHQDFEFNTRIHTDSNTLMRTHRSHFFRVGFFSFLGKLFRPKSEAFLEKYGFFNTTSQLSLVEAVRDLDLDKVRSLLNHSNVNQKDNYGYGSTPLTTASYRGDIAITQLLIDKGAEVNSDALNAAIQAGNLDIVQLLLNNGANVNIPDSTGLTPLRQAIHYISYHPFQSRFGYSWSVRVDIINEILKHDIQWFAHTKDGQTIFDYVETQKNQFISNWPTHENRKGLEHIYEVIKSAEKMNKAINNAFSNL